MTQKPWRPTDMEDRAEDHVARFLGATWRATLLFVIGVGGGALLLGLGLPASIIGAVLALLVTPLVWWWRIGREGRPSGGRGAAAGALIMPIVWILGLAVFQVATEAGRPPDWHPAREWAKFGGEFLFLLGAVGSLVCAAVGALYGAIVAWLERASSRTSPPA